MNTILFVDDEQEFLDIIVPRMRDKWGYNVVIFTEGLKAIEYLKTNKPDLALVDLGLQDVSGMKVLVDAKAQYPDLTVWIVSGFNSPDIKDQAMKLKADDFIAKPFMPKEFKEKLEAFFLNKK